MENVKRSNKLVEVRDAVKALKQQASDLAWAASDQRTIAAYLDNDLQMALRTAIRTAHKLAEQLTSVADRADTLAHGAISTPPQYSPFEEVDGIKLPPIPRK